MLLDFIFIHQVFLLDFKGEDIDSRPIQSRNVNIQIIRIVNKVSKLFLKRIKVTLCLLLIFIILIYLIKEIV